MRLECAFGSRLKDKGAKKKNEWFLVNPYLVAGVIGSSFCFTWFFSVLTTTDFIARPDWLEPSFSAAHVLFVAGLFVGYLAIWLLSDRLQACRVAMVSLSLVCALSHSVGIFFGFEPNLLYLLAVFGGLGTALLAALWMEFLCALLKAQLRVVMATVLALSFLWYTGTVLVDIRLLPYIITFYALASGLTYLFLHLRFSLMDFLPLVPAKASDKRLRITWKPSLLTVMGSVAQGFSLYWLLVPSVHTFGVSLLLEGGALVVFVLLLVDSLKSFFIKESFIRKLFIPVLAACILPLFFLPKEWWILPCMLAFLFSLMPYASAVFATCEHIVRCDLSPLRVFGWARLFSTAGLLFGLIAGWIAFSTEAFGSMTLSVMVVIVVMFFILVSSTISVQSYYPGEEWREEKRIVLGPHGELVAETPPIYDAETGVKFFHMKCDAVAKEYSLSKRQTEVLHLLAKGRNAEYIQKQLVISPHTAKAHIYKIYQKTGSHSRQDLMDLVENAAVEEEFSAEIA